MCSGRISSYKDFERAMKGYRKPVISERQIIFELCITSLTGFCDIAVAYARNLSKMILASKTEAGRNKYNIVEKFGEDGTIRQMAHKLDKLAEDFNDELKSIFYDQEESKEIVFCDNIDFISEIMSEAISATGRFIYQKVSKTTLSTPLDPGLLSDFILCFVFDNIVIEMFDNIKFNFSDMPMYVERYKFLRMNKISEQSIKLIRKLPFHDTKGGGLHYNINGVLSCKEVEEISRDIVYVLYSSELLSRISKTNTCGKIDVMQNYDEKSVIPKYNNVTPSIDEFREKYKNKFKN